MLSQVTWNSLDIYGMRYAYSVLLIEPAMDDLILMVFGDESIFLTCNSGECLHYTMVPGFKASSQRQYREIS